MAAPPPQQTATGPDGEPVFTTTAPPAYSEKEALGEGQAPTQQPAQLGGQLPQGQYPLQVGGAFPQIWPQGYPVSLARTRPMNKLVSIEHNPRGSGDFIMLPRWQHT